MYYASILTYFPIDTDYNLQNHVGKFQYFGRGLPLGHGKRYKELNKTMVCAVTSCTGQYSFQ